MKKQPKSSTRISPTTVLIEIDRSFLVSRLRKSSAVLKKLEERLADESAQLRRDLTERLEEMGAQLRKDIRDISTELEADNKKRTELSELFANISLSLKGKAQDQDLG